MIAPRLLILTALLSHLRAAVPPDPDNLERPAFKVRHWRFRNPTSRELPCVSIRYVGEDPQGTNRATDNESPSTAEDVIELSLDFIADAPLPPERDSVDGGDDDDGEDPTGLEAPSDMLSTLYASLWSAGEEAENLGGLLWDIRWDGTAPDDDLGTPDGVRLAERVTLMYRVRAEAPQHLLRG